MGLILFLKLKKNGDFICLHSFFKLDQLPLGIIAPASLARVGSDDNGGVSNKGAINNHMAFIFNWMFHFWVIKAY